jgi:hypothetical protein
VLVLVIAMLVILLLAAGVVLYAAYPARGERPPVAPWLGEAVERAADAVPTLDAERDHDWSLHR